MIASKFFFQADVCIANPKLIWIQNTVNILFHFPPLTLQTLHIYPSSFHTFLVEGSLIWWCWQVYSEQDTSKMPLELGSTLLIERESVDDPEIRVEALEAIYLIAVQVV